MFLYLHTFGMQGQVPHWSVKFVSDIVYSSGELGAGFNCLGLDITSQSTDCILSLHSLCNNLYSYFVLLKEPQ